MHSNSIQKRNVLYQSSIQQEKVKEEIHIKKPEMYLKQHINILKKLS